MVFDYSFVFHVSTKVVIPKQHGDPLQWVKGDVHTACEMQVYTMAMLQTTCAMVFPEKVTL